MQTGFVLLLLISLFASFADLSNPDKTYFWAFYALVILFVINLAIYLVNKLKNIIEILSMNIKSSQSVYTGLGLSISLFAVHAGIALFFVGNMLDLNFGYNQHIELRPGETFTLPALDAKLKLQDFVIDYYQDGSPSQYTSKVLVNEKDKEIPYEITVNHPLEVSGCKLYQESYSWMMNIEVGTGDKTEKYLVKAGDEVAIGDKKVRIIRFVPQSMLEKMSGREYTGKEAIVYAIPSLNVSGVAITGEKVKVNDNEYLSFVDKQAFTVLKVKTSPGMPFVELGGALLVIGIILVFWFKRNNSMRVKDIRGVSDND
jgi:cytochrome c biogenesis protein